MKALEEAIYRTLDDDTTLSGMAPGGVWRSVAPASATGTVVVFDMLSSADDYVLAQRATTTCLYTIKAVTPGTSSAPAWNAAGRIDDLLSDQDITLTGAVLMSCRRAQLISLVETDGGEMYQHVGGIYTFMSQETP